MLPGLMQDDFQLSLQYVLRRMRSFPNAGEVVTLTDEGITRASHGEVVARIESQMHEIESQRQHSLGGMEAHLATLSKDTLALSQALRGPNSRGRKPACSQVISE